MIIWATTAQELLWTGLRGYLHTPYCFEELVARLITLSGQPGIVPAHPDSDGKISIEFLGTWRGQAFRLYDYKEDREIHIGGHQNLDVFALKQFLQLAITTVDPTPYHADEHYDRRAGHQWPQTLAAAEN